MEWYFRHNVQEEPSVVLVRIEGPGHAQRSPHGAAEGGFCRTAGLSLVRDAGTFLDSNGLGAMWLS